MVRHGKIVRFFVDKGYGFVEDDEGESYHLHINNRHHVAVDSDLGVKFTDHRWFERGLDPYPQEGDEMLFETKTPQNGGTQPQASPWAYIEDLEEALAKLTGTLTQCFQILGYVPVWKK